MCVSVNIRGRWTKRMPNAKLINLMFFLYLLSTLDAILWFIGTNHQIQNSNGMMNNELKSINFSRENPMNANCTADAVYHISRCKPKLFCDNSYRRESCVTCLLRASATIVGPRRHYCRMRSGAAFEVNHTDSIQLILDRVCTYPDLHLPQKSKPKAKWLNPSSDSFLSWPKIRSRVAVVDRWNQIVNACVRGALQCILRIWYLGAD